MAATNTDIDLPYGVWTLLTGADVTAVRVQNIGSDTIRLQATTGTTAPTSVAGSLLVEPTAGVDASVDLADLFPGVSGAARVWARPLNDVSKVAVSHA